MIMDIISEKTIASKFRRLAYFHGMLLTEEDLLEEQTYFREKLKLHNRLHGKGIVQGLEVIPGKVSDCTTCDNTDTTALITIQPGYALDCEGNEITVCNPYSLSLDTYIDQLILDCRLNCCNNSQCEESEEQKIYLWVGIAYGECRSNPAHQYIAPCDSSPVEQYSRVREGFRVVIRAGYIDEPQDLIRTQWPDRCIGADPDCPNDMVIYLACIKICNCCGGYKQISQEKIVMEGVRKFAWTAMTSGKWDTARQELLSASESQYRDLSQLIGLSKNNAEQLLQKMGIESEVSLKPSDLNDKREIVRNAAGLVKVGSKVNMVTDEKGEKVLFILPINNLNQTV